MGFDMDNIGKLLTVVIPTYNMEVFLPECLASVTAACVPDTLEVIVVNDGSTDGSLQIARQYETMRPDIVRVIDKENGNYGSCVNVGLSAATGKYFRILDADDCFDTSALLELLGKLKDCEAGLVVTLITEDIYQNGMKVDERRYPFDTVRKDFLYRTDEICLNDYVRHGEMRMHSMTYLTSVVRESGLCMPEGVCYTDNVYLFQPFAYTDSLIVYDICLYRYRIGREGQTMAPDRLKKNLRDISVVACHLLREFDGTPQDKHLKANQETLFQGCLGLLMGILRMQKGVAPDCRDLLDEIIRGLNKYGISHREFRKKWYFRLWKNTESSRVLNVVLAIDGFVK